MQLIGLDVGFSKWKATSGVATLTGTVCQVGRATATLDDRGRLLRNVSMADVVAIDAPLLPTATLCIRNCERLFARGKIQKRFTEFCEARYEPSSMAVRSGSF